MSLRQRIADHAVDRVTDYRSRYGYPPQIAVMAEFWWRLEHVGHYRGGDGGLCGVVSTYAYGQRKAWEHRGVAAGVSNDPSELSVPVTPPWRLAVVESDDELEPVSQPPPLEYEDSDFA